MLYLFQKLQAFRLFDINLKQDSENLLEYTLYTKNLLFITCLLKNSTI